MRHSSRFAPVVTVKSVHRRPKLCECPFHPSQSGAPAPPAPDFGADDKDDELGFRQFAPSGNVELQREIIARFQHSIRVLAVEDFQRRYDLVADGIAGPLTMATLQHAIETELRSIGQPDAPYLRSEQSTESLSAYRTLSPEPVASPVMPVLRLDDPAHPDNGLYQEAQAYVHNLDRQYAKEPDQYSDNLSAALVVAARSEGLCRIDGIELTKNASHLSAVQSSLGEPDKRAEVPIMASLNLPMERSSDRWPDAMQAYEMLEEASREQVRVQPIAAMPEVSTNRYADPVAAGHGRKDPRHPESANHELYNELQRRVPDASEDRLLQFTAACHESQITADNLVEARLDEDRGTLTFIGTGPLTRPARIDLDSAPPYPEQAIAQIQQNDQQQAQVMEEVRMQQAQMSMGHSR
ncbi:XVIPCD domain-containing protein [Luteibacter sp. NPDC031894]|uniref:XVIPCD domain-containing protein n=1 Tax=Luteibacter sp. NPDC031894 TaxID=3390572 RepID=UPI003CFE73A0